VNSILHTLPDPIKPIWYFFFLLNGKLKKKKKIKGEAVGKANDKGKE